MLNNSNNASLIQSGNNDDLSSLRTLLLSMFREADDDGNGYLTYDEFEMLMEKVELGISHSELRKVIQEADENENGVFDDGEIPLSIQSFSIDASNEISFTNTATCKFLSKNCLLIPKSIL